MVNVICLKVKVLISRIISKPSLAKSLESALSIPSEENVMMKTFCHTLARPNNKLSRMWIQATVLQHKIPFMVMRLFCAIISDSSVK